MKITQEQAERLYTIGKQFCLCREGSPGGCECCWFEKEWDGVSEYRCDFDALLDEIEKENGK